MNKTNQYSLLDLFSGCGGLSYGFQQAGFEVIAGIDNWKDALATFQKNHPTSQGILMDLAELLPPRYHNKLTNQLMSS